MSTKISEILDAIQERQQRRKLTDIKQFNEIADTQDIKKSNEDIKPTLDIQPTVTSTNNNEQEVIGEDSQEEDHYEESLQKLQHMLQFKSPKYKSPAAESEDEFKSPKYKSPTAEFEDEFDDEENINIRIQNIQNMLEDQTASNSIRKFNVFPVTVSSENFDNGLSSTWPMQCSKGEPLFSNFGSIEHISTDLNANILLESDIKDNLSAAKNQNIDLYEILLEKLDNLLDEEGDMKNIQQVQNDDSGNYTFDSTTNDVNNTVEEISECIDADGAEFIDDCDAAVLVVAGEDLIDCYDLIDDSYADSIENDSANFIAADMMNSCDADMKSASDADANDDADADKINTPDDDGRDADGMIDDNDDGSIDFIGGSREFISHQIMFHNIVEMLRKLEEVQRKFEQIWSHHDQIWSSHNQIWLSDLQIWKHRTQCRITELRILLGGVGIATDSYFYSTVVYRPDNEKTDDIVRYVNSQYDNIRNKGKPTCRAI